MKKSLAIIVLLGSICVLLMAQAKSSHPSAKRQPATTFDPAVVNDATTRPDLADKAAGSAALRAQILLDRANFSVGEIDGTIGNNTETALAGFRTKRQLPNGTGVDQAVWQALNEDQETALTTYELTAADLKGPFVKVPADMMAKARLKQLGYASPLDGLAEKFHIAPMLLRRLNPGKRFRSIGEKLTVPNVRKPLSAQAAKIVVSKSAKTVTALDAAGSVLAQYPSSIGSERDPLPIGEWKINGITKNPAFHYNPDLFWDAKPGHTKETIAPGPRNPVGLVWIDLSKEHYGIHGTPTPATIGYAQSHGCIRLVNWDALELAGLIGPGTPASLVE